MRRVLGRPWPLLGLLAVLLAVAGCTGSTSTTGSSGGPAANAEADLRALVDRYVERSLARDPQGLADMFTDPATWIDPTGTQELSREDIKALFDGMFSIVTEIYHMEARGIETTVSGDTATVQFQWEQDVENAVLGRTQSSGSMKWSVRRIGGQWYINQAQTEIDPS